MKSFGEWADRAVDNATAAVVAGPGEGVVVIGPECPFRRIALRVVDAEEDANATSGVRPVDAKELADVFERLAGEGSVQGVVGGIEFDDDSLVLCQVGCASPADHASELGPVFLAALFEISKPNGRSVDSKESPAADDEFDQILTEGRVGEQVADRVVQADGVELFEVFLFKDGRGRG